MSLSNLFLFIFYVTSVYAYEPDRVLNLPGLSESIPFKAYSGYLNATRGTYLHYTFVESQGNPSTDPLLLWLNGGPGCSSLLGFFEEQGPYLISKDGRSLTVNQYSWNKVANMIFLESPAGVGYSYSDSRNYTHNDDETSLNNLLAIKSFYQKFPQFKTNDFYITGESYGGVYIPTLSVRLLNESNINYKGFAVGNGFLDQILLGNSVIRFAYYHGLIDRKFWSQIVKSCCKNGSESEQTCQFVKNPRSKCNKLVYKVRTALSAISLNVYDIYDKCLPNNSTYQGFREKFGWNLISKSLGVSKDIELSIPCIDDSNLISYLNRLDVRKALNIPENLNQDWSDCSGDVNSNYQMQYSSMKSQVTQTIKSGKRGLIYNGDVDMACDFIGDEWFSENLGLPEISSYSPWMVDGQIGGFAKQYQGLTFTTIRGAGHTVPQYRPVAAYKMIAYFLQNKSFN